MKIILFRLKGQNDAHKVDATVFPSLIAHYASSRTNVQYRDISARFRLQNPMAGPCRFSPAMRTLSYLIGYVYRRIHNNELLDVIWEMYMYSLSNCSIKTACCVVYPHMHMTSLDIADVIACVPDTWKTGMCPEPIKSTSDRLVIRDQKCHQNRADLAYRDIPSVRTRRDHLQFEVGMTCGT